MIKGGPMIKDFAAFLDALNREDADYVVIGGFAVISYIPYRTTRAIDVLIEPSIDNARNVRCAVQTWGDFEPDFSAEEFIAGDILSFGDILRVEVHSDVPGVTWEQVDQGKVVGELSGVSTYFAGLDELLAMKKATGREDKDKPDVERLSLLKEQRDRSKD